MLRFDIAPVSPNAYRLVATVSFLTAAVYLFTPYKWIAAVLVIGGFLRGFVSPHRCLSYKLFEQVVAKLGGNKTVNAGAKMFADKIAFIAGSVMLGTGLAGSDIGLIPGYAILTFAFLDLATGFCAACWAYGLYYKLKGA